MARLSSDFSCASVICGRRVKRIEKKYRRIFLAIRLRREEHKLSNTIMLPRMTVRWGQKTDKGGVEREEDEVESEGIFVVSELLPVDEDDDEDDDDELEREVDGG